jgi:uncharacterized protein YjiS (DUF1127 family)
MDTSITTDYAGLIQMSDTLLLNVGISRSQMYYNSTQRGR